MPARARAPVPVVLDQQTHGHIRLRFQPIDDLDRIRDGLDLLLLVALLRSADFYTGETRLSLDTLAKRCRLKDRTGTGKRPQFRALKAARRRLVDSGYIEIRRNVGGPDSYIVKSPGFSPPPIVSGGPRAGRGGSLTPPAPDGQTPRAERGGDPPRSTLRSSSSDILEEQRAHFMRGGSERTGWDRTRNYPVTDANLGAYGPWYHRFEESEGRPPVSREELRAWALRREPPAR